MRCSCQALSPHVVMLLENLRGLDSLPLPLYEVLLARHSEAAISFGAYYSLVTECILHFIVCSSLNELKKKKNLHLVFFHFNKMLA